MFQTGFTCLHDTCVLATTCMQSGRTSSGMCVVNRPLKNGGRDLSHPPQWNYRPSMCIYLWSSASSVCVTCHSAVKIWGPRWPRALLAHAPFPFRCALLSDRSKADLWTQTRVSQAWLLEVAATFLSTHTRTLFRLDIPTKIQCLHHYCKSRC